MKIKKGRLVILCLVIVAVVITTIILTRPKFVPLSRYKTDKESILKILPLGYPPAIEKCYYRESGDMRDYWIEAFIYLNDEDFNFYMTNYHWYESAPRFEKGTDPKMFGIDNFNWYTIGRWIGESEQPKRKNNYMVDYYMDINNKIMYVIIIDYDKNDLMW